MDAPPHVTPRLKLKIVCPVILLIHRLTKFICVFEIICDFDDFRTFKTGNASQITFVTTKYKFRA